MDTDRQAETLCLSCRASHELVLVYVASGTVPILARFQRQSDIHPDLSKRSCENGSTTVYHKLYNLYNEVSKTS